MLSSTNKDKMHDIDKLGFRIDDISVEFGGHICQQPVLYKKTHYL